MVSLEIPSRSLSNAGQRRVFSSVQGMATSLLVSLWFLPLADARNRRPPLTRGVSCGEDWRRQKPTGGGRSVLVDRGAVLRELLVQRRMSVHGIAGAWRGQRLLPSRAGFPRRFG